jgi:hypothetical protein
MSIVNRRNAVLGWSVWQVGKRMAKKKAKSAIPGRGSSGGVPKGGIVSAIAALGGVLFLWRRKRSGGDDADAAQG